MANKLPSVIQSGTNNYLTPSLSFNRVLTDHIAPGIVGTIANTSGVAPSTGSFAVNAQGSPNMTVAVSSGQLYVSATPSGGTAQTFAVTSDASENVTIAANATGGTRYDFVYLQLDSTKLNAPAVNGLDVPSFITQRSTTQYVDSNGAASNAILLAEVTVANSASSISNANISDRRVPSKPFHGDGWFQANETWTYASATTFTISGDVTLKYNVGDRVKLTQSGTIKYFYITAISYGSPNTTVTINGGTDYTLANAAVYNNFFSKHISPNGFPVWFNYTPTYTGFSAAPTVNSSNPVRFALAGRVVTVNHSASTGTSNTTAFTVSLPITASATYLNQNAGILRTQDNGGASSATPGYANIAAAATTATFYRAMDNSTWTNANAKAAYGNFIYEI